MSDRDLAEFLDRLQAIHERYLVNKEELKAVLDGKQEFP